MTDLPTPSCWNPPPEPARRAWLRRAAVVAAIAGGLGGVAVAFAWPLLRVRADA